jgi:polyhydroxyalkanoate synthesis regulator phasin
MDLLKNLAYAGLGLLESTDETLKQKFAELVEKGKTHDTEGKNLINDLFKSIEESDETIKTKYNKSIETLQEKLSKMKVEVSDEV